MRTQRLWHRHYHTATEKECHIQWPVTIGIERSNQNQTPLTSICCGLILQQDVSTANKLYAYNVQHKLTINN